jgi:hypothetical protein
VAVWAYTLIFVDGSSACGRRDRAMWRIELSDRSDSGFVVVIACLVVEVYTEFFACVDACAAGHAGALVISRHGYADVLVRAVALSVFGHFPTYFKTGVCNNQSI